MSTRGFTLLETILYIALLTLLLFGMILPLTALRDSMQRTRTQARLVDEALFLDDVFDQIIVSATAVEFPMPGDESSSLTLVNNGVPVRDYVASSTLFQNREGEAEPISDGDIMVGPLTVHSYTGSTTLTKITIKSTLSAWGGIGLVSLPYEHTAYLEL